MDQLQPESGDGGDGGEAHERLRERARVSRNDARKLTAEYVELLTLLERGAATEPDRKGSVERELGMAVREYAAVLHEMNVPPERVVADVKALVFTAASDQRRQVSELMPRIVSMAIDAYYGG